MELKELLDRLWQRRLLVGGTFTAILLFFVLYLLFVQSSYKVSARVHLRRSEAAPTLFDSMGLTLSTNQQTTPGSTDQEEFILLATSKPYLEEVIRKLDLKRDRVSDYILNDLLKLGVEIDRKPVSPEELRKPSPLSIFFPRPSVSAKQHGESNIFSITAKSTSVDEVVDMANTLADLIVTGEREVIRRDFEEARSRLVAYKPKVDDLLDSAYTKAKAFKQRSGTVDAVSEISGLLTQISSLQEDKASNQVSLEKALAEKAVLIGQLDTIKQSRIEMVNNPATEHIEELKQQLLSEQLDLAEGLSKYTPEHPDLVAIRDKIDLLNKQLKREVVELFQKENLYGGDSFNTISESLSSCMANIMQLEAAAYSLEQAESSVRELLLRKMKDYYEYEASSLAEGAAESLFENYNKTMALLDLLESAAIAGIRVVEPATIPVKLGYIQKPNPYVVGFLAIFLGTFGSLGIGLVAIFLDDTLQSPAQLPMDSCNYLHAAIPRFPRLRRLVLRTFIKRRDIDGAFQKMAYEVERRVLDLAPAIAVTSILPGAGRTLLASGLATALARRGRRVALVDFNLASERLTSIWARKRRAQGEDMTDPKLRGTVVDGLDFVPLPLDKGAPLEASVLADHLAFVDSLSSRYDVIIIGMPALSDESNLLDFLGTKTRILCVIPHRKVECSEFDAFDRMMRDCNQSPYFCTFNRYVSESFAQGLTRWRRLLRNPLRAFFRRSTGRRVV